MRMVGMKVPGFTACGSAIQRRRLPGVLLSVTAAIELRLARWVRSGPGGPGRVVPRMVWQLPHARVAMAAAPAVACAPTGVAAGLSWLANQAANCADDSTMTLKCMWACCLPQKLAHTPR